MGGQEQGSWRKPGQDAYAEALDYIHGFYKFGSVLGLERIRTLLEMLGNPHRAFKCVHVAGTNGKGSVTAMVASILERAGYTVGRYISPYIQDFRERIAVNDRLISAEDVVALVDEIRPVVSRMVSRGNDSPTEFEVVTAMGFCHFARCGVDVAVVEVGLGGRFDATNVIEAPVCSVITKISLDHTDRLGGTLSAIAYEKAGIIKPDGVTVSAPQQAEPLAVLRNVAAERGNRFYLVGDDMRWRQLEASDAGQFISVEGVLGKFDNLFIPLLGVHQQENAVTAVSAVAVADRRGFPVSEAAIREGLARVKWPGRLEVVRRSPLVLIDGAHNPDGARSLAEALRTIFAYEKLFLVLGILGDKGVNEMVDQLVPLAHRVFLSKPDSPRAMDPAQLAGYVAAHTKSYEVVPDVVEATGRALALAGSRDAVCITGSLYLIGRARSYLLGESVP